MNSIFRRLSLLAVIALSIAACDPTVAPPRFDDATMEKARALAAANIIVDGHIDVPYRLREEPEDISVGTGGGDFDYPRANQGGLDAPFMSIYIPARLQDSTGMSRTLADSLVDMVEDIAEQSPDKFALARTVSDVRSNHERGLISLPMGMENGSGLENDLSNVQHFYDRGIRYVTLTHSRANLIGDSSYDTTRVWNGLSEYGRAVVGEMNRLGIMVDISHVTDSTFYDALEVTRAPAIASHSSARAFTPGFERNMSDDMIRALANNGGVIMINFGSSFLDDDYRTRSDSARQVLREYMEDHDLGIDDQAFRDYARDYYRENVGYADLDHVVEHINHVVGLVGVDHVGLGSDFDGLGDSLPIGLKDVSDYPNLIAALLVEGYSDDDISKILGENALRVWSEVEAVSASFASR